MDCDLESGEPGAPPPALRRLRRPGEAGGSGSDSGSVALTKSAAAPSSAELAEEDKENTPPSSQGSVEADAADEDEGSSPMKRARVSSGAAPSAHSSYLDPTLTRHLSAPVQPSSCQAHAEASSPPKRGVSDATEANSNSSVGGVPRKRLYNQHVRAAKEYEQAGDLRAALQCYESARDVLGSASDSLAKKIKFLQKKLNAVGCSQPHSQSQSQPPSHPQLQLQAHSPSYSQQAASAQPVPEDRNLEVQAGDKWAYDAQREQYVAIMQFNDSASAAIPASSSSSAAPVAPSLPSTLHSSSPFLSRFSLPASMWPRLYSYQRDGVYWLFERVARGIGGVLADDMGCGKTVQLASFLAGAFYSRQVRHALIAAPLSVLEQWKGELAKWAGAAEEQSSREGLRLLLYTTKGTRASLDARLKTLMASSRGGIVLTSYGLIRNRLDSFTNFPPSSSSSSCSGSGRPRQWDLLILDEAHQIKSESTKSSQACNAVPARVRLALTGTPILNTIQEMASLANFVTQGSELGARLERLGTLVTTGLSRDASPEDIQRFHAARDKLRKELAPIFLRREKANLPELNGAVAPAVPVDASADDAAALGSIPRSFSSSSSVAVPSLTVQKNDLIVWHYMSPLQETLYRSFLSSPGIKAIFMSQTRSPLVALSVLKKICDHPRLLSEKMRLCEQIGEDIGRLPSLPSPSDSPDALERAVRLLTDESGKMRLLELLLLEQVSQGHRVLIFSQSTKVLGFVELLLHRYRWPFLRIDGKVSDHEKRKQRQDLFNADTKYRVMLLTTRAGGVGMNLCGADRVIIYDPDWTASLDNQAVDRAYRIGQTRNVVVYRFITCGTVEEVIYRKQVFKGSIIRAATAVEQADEQLGDLPASAPVRAASAPSASKRVARYFNQNELREVFHFSNPRTSSTYDQLMEKHPPSQRRSYPELEQHIESLHHFDGVHGITDHDLLFKQAGPRSAEEEQAEADAEEEADPALSELRDLDDDAWMRTPKPKRVAKPRRKEDSSRKTRLEIVDLTAEDSAAESGQEEQSEREDAEQKEEEEAEYNPPEDEPLFSPAPPGGMRLSMSVQPPISSPPRHSLIDLTEGADAEAEWNPAEQHDEHEAEPEQPQPGDQEESDEESSDEEAGDEPNQNGCEDEPVRDDDEPDFDLTQPDPPSALDGAPEQAADERDDASKDEEHEETQHDADTTLPYGEPHMMEDQPTEQRAEEEKEDCKEPLAGADTDEEQEPPSPLEHADDEPVLTQPYPESDEQRMREELDRTLPYESSIAQIEPSSVVPPASLLSPSSAVVIDLDSSSSEEDDDDAADDAGDDEQFEDAREWVEVPQAMHAEAQPVSEASSWLPTARNSAAALSAQQCDAYNAHLDQAMRVSLSGGSSNEGDVQRLSHFLDALQLSDQDPTLHAHIMQMAVKLNWLQ